MKKKFPGMVYTIFLCSESPGESEKMLEVLSSLVMVPAECSTTDIPLPAKWWTKLNQHLPLDSLHHPDPVNKDCKHGTHFDTENCDVSRSKSRSSRTHSNPSP